MSESKIVERIRKLLAMAEDSGSPNEAAIAAGRAAKLMQQHNLERAEITIKTMAPDDITGVKSEAEYRAVPGWVSSLIHPVAMLHDCEARYVTDGRCAPWRAEFLGTMDDAQAAAYVLGFLIGEIDRLAKAYKKRSPHVGRAGMGDFRRGAARGVVEVIRHLQAEKQLAEQQYASGTGLAIRKSDLIQQKYNVTYKKKAIRQRGTAAYFSGVEDGRRVSIREGIGTDADRGRLAGQG